MHETHDLPSSPPPPENPRLKVAVRDLVEFVLQCGDLTSTFVGAGRALAGTRGHQKIQKARPENYQAEVPVSLIHAAPHLTLEISGRIDGVWRHVDSVVIDEIKTTTQSLSDITIENQPLHWGQAKVYAYLFARENELECIGVQLTYLQIDSLEVLEHRAEFCFSDLETFFQDLVTRYLEWASTIQEWHQCRNASIQKLTFPFSTYREGQRHLAVAVYRAIADGHHLFAQAPTGIGKTVATLFPALKALGNSLVAKVFYLTAKTVGRGVAEQALAGMRENGLRCKVLTLTAKEKCCFLPKPDCRPEACEYARGHYDRVKPALAEIFSRDCLDRPAIEETARAHRVCPFEFALFISLGADVIIGDYNYAFDPRVYLRRFFEPPADAYAFLIDEAHNLPDRAREMFSAELRRSDFTTLRTQIKEVFPAVAKVIAKITPYFQPGGKTLEKALAKGSDKERETNSEAEADPTNLPGLSSPSSGNGTPPIVSKDLPTDLIQVLRRFLKVAESVLVDNEPSPHREALLEVFFKATGFVRVSETFDQNFVFYVEHTVSSPTGPGGRVRGRLSSDIRLKQFCLDPADLLRTALQRARSAIFFSATLLPMTYFFQILGGGEADKVIKLASPFAAHQLGLMVLPRIRTAYREREKSYGAIAEVIHLTALSRQGNYLVYFPSYRYMTAVREVFTATHPRWKIIEQTTGMSEEARDEFLSAFSAKNTGTLIGFVVMGGIFGEGIDLRGERLIGSIVVGVGLPQICLERDLIRDCFQQKGGKGFEFAYRYPGLNRVMQAAGRVIRTEQDRGVVLLIDERFVQVGYRSLFPKEWSHACVIEASDRLRRQLEDFWNEDLTRRRIPQAPPE